MKNRRQYPRLWSSGGDNASPDSLSGNDNNKLDDSSLEDLSELIDRFSSKQTHSKPLSFFWCNSLVVGQEFSLTCLFLRFWVALLQRDQQLQNHQNQSTRTPTFMDENYQWRETMSLGLFFTALIVTIGFNELGSGEKPNKQPKKEKARQRVIDALLLAGILRLLAAVLRTLTASYSSDTVYALALFGMVVHLFTCDYAYANGRTKIPPTSVRNRRPAFLGGTMSLNAALFATTLLVSRLSSNLTVYGFFSSSIVLFGFYPANRHAVGSQPNAHYVVFYITAAITCATLVLLDRAIERFLFVLGFATITLVAPTWKFLLQHRKLIVSGPWDIAHVSVGE